MPFSVARTLLTLPVRLFTLPVRLVSQESGLKNIFIDSAAIRLESAATMKSKVRYAVILAALALSYFLAARLSHSLSSAHWSTPTLWPATGLALATVILLGSS